MFRRLHERKGVAFRLGQEVAAVEGDGRVREVVLRDGSRLPADLVVAGLGIAPATDFLRGVERREDGGVTVDARLRAAEALFAAGDIAAFPLRGDGPAVRVEHWRVAEQHGRVAALNMLGREASYDAVPYFWTIHFKKRLDYIGHAAPGDEVVVDGDLERPEFIACYLRDGRVTAVAGWDRDRQMAAAIHLMTERRDWTRAGLRDALRGWA
ncbi:MAG: FAD-dependent oxidoreductase [Acetobacteraceae bacterium]|nr:FAD-dependent oxidoreductase [Acetobacteraceae bacterium]